MSCYEWERAEIKIPSAAWVPLKKALRESYNRGQKAAYERAIEVYDRILREGQGKRGFDYRSRANDLSEYADWVDLMFAKGRPDPLAPRKNWFPLATEATHKFESTDAYIGLNDAARLLTWYVPENNHACERAHEWPLYGVLLRELDRIEWTANSGGTLWGANEYDEDSDQQSTNRVQRTWGASSGKANIAKAKQAVAAKAKASPSWNDRVSTTWDNGEKLAVTGQHKNGSRYSAYFDPHYGGNVDVTVTAFGAISKTFLESVGRHCRELLVAAKICKSTTNVIVRAEISFK